MSNDYQEAEKLSPEILVVGAVTCDKVVVKQDLIGDGKGDGEDTYTITGGAGANLALTIVGLSKLFNNKTWSDIVFTTRIGDKPKKKHYEDLEHFLDALNAYRSVTRSLKKLRSINATPGAVKIPFNTVIEHKDGRSIYRDPVKIAPRLGSNMKDRIRTFVSRSPITPLDPKTINLAQYAIEAAIEYKHETYFDYGFGKWPDDELLAKKITYALENATYLKVPSDAVVKGMSKPNPKELFQRLRSDYNAQNIAMSDGVEPIKVLINGEEQPDINVRPHTDGPLFASGAGDTSNAGFIAARTLGYSAYEAFSIGATLASEKVKHPGRKWLKKFNGPARAQFEHEHGDLKPQTNNPVLNKFMLS